MIYGEITAEGSMVQYSQNGNVLTEKLQRSKGIEIYRKNDTSNAADTTVGTLNFFGCPSFSEPTFTNFNIMQSTHNTLPLRVGVTYFFRLR